MAWSASAVFRAYETDTKTNVISGANWDLDAPTAIFLAALYDNDITPSKDVTSANSAFNVDQWAIAGNEVTDAGAWVTGGRQIDGLAITNPSAGVVMLDATDEVSGTVTTAITNAFGTLIYNDTVATPVANQGLCYLYFGGGNSVSPGGTLTLQWHANGLIRWTV